MTYVVVFVWDLRRLLVPLSYFIEKPLQNWTRQTADLLGTVFVHADYTLPVEEVRQELHRILQSRSWGRQSLEFAGHEPLADDPGTSRPDERAEQLCGTGFTLPCARGADCVRSAELSPEPAEESGRNRKLWAETRTFVKWGNKVRVSKGSQSLRTTLEPTGWIYASNTSMHPTH
jgi:hypothetical protein